MVDKRLKRYETNQAKKTPDAFPLLGEPSGVGCTEGDGEMMIVLPEQIHPELPPLRRAICDTCGWMGWV